MSEELRWNVSVQIVGGPTVAESGLFMVNEYCKLHHVVSANGELDVNIDLTTAKLLMLRASQYVDINDSSKKLNYAINSDPGGTGSVSPGPKGDLIAPLMLMGKDAISLLGNPVTMIKLTNSMETDVIINIIIGGDATPNS